MFEKIETQFFSKSVLFFLAVFITGLSINHLKAQTTETEKSEELQSLRSGAGIVGITGNLRWYTFYTNTANGGLDEESQTELQLEFRNIRMLNTHFGLGYKIFSTVFMSGFFEGGGLGGAGGGSIVRLYPLETSRWQPYLQGNFTAGYNLALSDALGINDVGGFRYRTALRSGLGYKVSNGFGLFFEIGPTWEYGEIFQLDSRALQIDLGIELFRF